MKEKQLHIIHRYLNNEIELEEVKASMSADEFNAWKETLDLSNDLPDVDFDVEKEYNLLQSRKEQIFSKHKPTGFRYLKIAAVFIALIASTFFIANYLNTQQLVQISSNETKENIIELPDLSKVSLNGVSNLTYSKANWFEERTLKLDGEAYFDVVEGSTFTVETENGSVQVLGTTFNVKSNDGQFSVTCYTGKVKVKYSDTEVILKPGQSINNVSKEINLVKTEMPDWINKTFSFDNVLLSEVLSKIETQRNIKIETKVNDSLYFTGGYKKNMTTPEILDLICQSLDLRYKEISEFEYQIYRLE